MVGLQWCKACDGPRFKWSVRDVDDIPERCLDCGKDQVEVHLAANSLSELRKGIGQWALGDSRPGRHASWLNRRKAHVQTRFDQVIGWWAKQESQPPEFKTLLKEYRTRGRPQYAPPDDAERGRSDRASPILAADRLHQLTEELKALAAEEKKSREAKAVRPSDEPRSRSWSGLANRWRKTNDDS
jgi:hypothetical protein